MPSSSTTLFDRLVAAGAPASGTRLRLADGTFLLVQASPGADTVEVFLYAGLTAPNTNAWTRDDLWEHLMTGGTPGDVSYRDVPVSAVRERILQHGGEHPDQDATPLDDRTAGAVLLAALAEHNIKTMTGDAELSLAIPLDDTTPLHEMFNQRHLLVASHGPSIDHAPENHTGWIVQLHDSLGHPVGDPIHAAGDGIAHIDCTTDSAAAAAAIAALRAAPVAN
ncbi:hypothetical protein ACIF84_30600 [Streptomyces albidoflavus]